MTSVAVPSVLVTIVCRDEDSVQQCLIPLPQFSSQLQQLFTGKPCYPYNDSPRDEAACQKYGDWYDAINAFREKADDEDEFPLNDSQALHVVQSFLIEI